ncbi:hypothetical protein [Shewanella aestuarii]|uniref:Site-specific integrase n=1 Tax=Shewanella aestuarii TaxID=1028752 RepID=A0A6G9QQ30_9GAMM|nr:hypothetical protein [Shewanella aestuarii]QIR16528.1 hypothetical protein HBH39_18805 [Shewanella aestuarii]
MNYIDELLAGCNDKSIHSDRVIRWANRYLSLSNDRSIYAFCDWFIAEILPKVTVKSANNYKRSLLLHITDQNLINYIHVNASDIAHKQKDKSKKKSKSICWDQFLAVEEELTHAQNSHFFISDWLRSSILTGLRPKEWCDAGIFHDLKGRLVLKTRNTIKAATTHDGEEYELASHRIIPLMNYDVADIECIKRHLAYIKISLLEGTYEQCYKIARQRLYYVSKKLFPNEPPINLYTGRHQFSANLKKSGVSSESIALLMGHNDITTARHAYGAKRHGEMDVIDIESTEETIKLFQELFAD